MNPEPNGRVETDGGVVLRGCGLTFEQRAGFRLGPLDLEIRRGERVALIGPNGSGKTTLLRLLAGLVRPDHGAVLLGDRPLRALSRAAIARRIAIVPQDVQIPMAFTVREVVGFGRIAHRTFWGGTARSNRAAIERAIESTGLGALAARRYQSLSGGERQQVILAMALAQEAEILLLDEPTSHLDPRARVELLALVERLAVERAVTVVAAVHDLNLASQFFGRIVLLAHGQKVLDAPARLAEQADLLRQVFGEGLSVLIAEDGEEVAIYRRPGRVPPRVV